MLYEPVHIIWGYYDGVRSGIADLSGALHYFDCRFDEAADEYSDTFILYPVDAEFMRQATRCWAIYRDWERRFYNGDTDIKSSPAHGGVDAEYDELKSWLEGRTTCLQSLPMLYKATFRERAGQEALPLGMMREIEVAWSASGEPC